MKVLVTGHKGFIGGYIFSYLSKKDNYEVSGYDLGDKFPDKKFDLIIHMAARGLIRKSIEMPYDYFQDNLDLTLKFLEKARLDNSAFVFPTSGSTAKPTNPYSLSKVNSEDWINLYRNLYNINAYVLRFFNIYGPGSTKGAVFLFTRAAMHNEVAIVYGDGTHKRDYFYIGDMGKVIDLISEKKIKPGDYQIGTGIKTTVNELISLVTKATGKQLKVKYEPYIIEEGDELYAQNPLITSYTNLNDGISCVIEFINKSNI